MGMGMDEVDIQPRPPQPQQQQQHHHQNQPAPPQQQQQGRHPHPHPPLQRREAGAAAAGGAGGSSAHPNNHGLSLSLPLHLAASGSSAKVANARDGLGGAAPPVQPPANGGAAAVPATGSGGADRHGHGHGRDDCWSEGATNTLIEAWGDRYLELNRGNLKQKHWKDVADAVSHRGDCSKPSKTDVQCKNRLDTLKKKYKLEKGKIFNGGATSKWPFFNKLDELIGPSRKHQNNNNNNSNIHQHHGTAVNNNINGAKSLPAPPGLKSAKEIRPSDDPHAHIRMMNQNNNSASSKSDETPDTTDSCPNGLDMTVNGKSFKKRKIVSDDGGGPFRELTRAIIKFGEVYERVERSKQQQLMDLEKQRMEFIKELELQRMQLFVQTQLELAKLKHAKHGNTEHYL